MNESPDPVLSAFYETGAYLKGHFRLTIVAAGFSGLTLVQRHRLVHDALAEMLPEQIHALSLVTRSPEELD